MFKKILLPVDLQEESSWQNALPVALRMAKDDGAELHILTVVPPLPGQIYGYFPEDFEPKMIDQGKAAGAIDSALSTPAIVALCRSISLGFVVMSALGQSLVAAEEWNPVVNRLLTAATPTLPADEPATINGKTQT